MLDTLVVGAGVIGLAIARELAQRGIEVVVLEAATGPGTGISSRNSEVIHAGLYYPPGSKKATTCVRGRERLYAYCRERGIAHRQLGKLIVATEENEIHHLHRIQTTATANGVRGLVWLDEAQLRRDHPDLRAIAALYSPRTGIIDSHGLMRALLGDAEDAGALVAWQSPLERTDQITGGWLVHVDGDRVPVRRLINAAGLGAWAIARSIHGDTADWIPPQYLAKGNYFALRGKAPFDTLVYPVPSDAGLGIHLTLDLAGQCRFGPDVEWVDDENYDVDPKRATAFEAAIRRYWPGLPSAHLVPDYAGIRPKIRGPGESAGDFAVLGWQTHGVFGLVHLLGIESPGLTAALALAEDVATNFEGASP